MPNKFLTQKEVCEIVLEEIKKQCGDDIHKQRAFMYDLQTTMGGFPFSIEEREKYIKTGKG